jgi:glutathione synthase/RimK-type ligase-like ATP-grasp enzyme
LRPDDQLLLYTDGVTEARDARRAFYPLPERVAVLAAKAAASQTGGKAVLKPVSSAGGRQAQSQTLLDLVRADLHKHVGAPLDDDAALLLVQAPVAWPADQATATSAAGARIANAS